MKILIVLIFVLGAISCHKKEETDALKGFWKLNAFEVQDSLGQWLEYGWNKGGTGYLLYDGAGYAAIHLTPKDYEKFDWNGAQSIDSMSVNELKESLKMLSGNYNYMASYTVDTIRKIVRHTRLSHSRPQDWGKTVERRYELIGADTLLLFPKEGNAPRRLTWIKVH